MKTETS